MDESMTPQDWLDLFVSGAPKLRAAGVLTVTFPGGASMVVSPVAPPPVPVPALSAETPTRPAKKSKPLNYIDPEVYGGYVLDPDSVPVNTREFED